MSKKENNKRIMEDMKPQTLRNEAKLLIKTEGLEVARKVMKQRHGWHGILAIKSIKWQ